MFLQQEIYPTNDRSVPPQARDLELLEGARLSKQIAARAQVSSCAGFRTPATMS
jgi:hypothetical protein